MCISQSLECPQIHPFPLWKQPFSIMFYPPPPVCLGASCLWRHAPNSCGTPWNPWKVDRGNGSHSEQLISPSVARTKSGKITIITDVFLKVIKKDHGQSVEIRSVKEAGPETSHIHGENGCIGVYLQYEFPFIQGVVPLNHDKFALQCTTAAWLLWGVGRQWNSHIGKNLCCPWTWTPAWILKRATSVWLEAVGDGRGKRRVLSWSLGKCSNLLDKFQGLATTH